MFQEIYPSLVGYLTYWHVTAHSCFFFLMILSICVINSNVPSSIFYSKSISPAEVLLILFVFSKNQL